MAKPALGKGLEHLMKGDAVGGKPPDQPGEAPRLGKGFKTLVNQEPAPTRKKELLLPPWFFFAADVLLLGFTVAILFNAPKPISWDDWLFCTITTSVAGLFGVIGVLLSAHQSG